jgi:transposase
METAYRRCCGIDVHKKSVVVYVAPPQGQGKDKALERQFRTFSRDLRSLRGWLKHCHVTEAVMESTGQYWRAVWNILEGEGTRLVLVNPAHVKALAGRKTDRIDSRRLAGFLERGELDGSFVPSREIRELRDLTRSRVHLLEEVNRVKNRIGQMCEAGNIKVSSVASDLFGVSGRRMLQAIVEGKRDPGWMADYARGRLRCKRKQLEQALDGTFSAHQRWMLREELGHLDGLEAQIARVREEIRVRMQPFAEQTRRLITIPGVDHIVAWTMVAELGPEMSVFPDADHAASWAGLCPGNRESGGKRLGGRTRKANAYLRRDLCQAAWAASHSQGTYLSALYYRLRGRIGHNQAILAVAHQILRVAYTMLRRGEDYRELGGDYFDQRNKPKVVHRLVERLARLGYQVQLEPAGGETAAGGSVDPPATADPQSPAVTETTPSQAGDATPTVEAATLCADGKRKRGRPCKCGERGIACTHHRKDTGLRKIQVLDNSTT